MALTAASAPLLPAFAPARSMACSMVSHVRTPKMHGTPVFMRGGGDALGGLRGDVLVVVRPAADDGAQADDGRVPAGRGQLLGQHRDLEAARRPDDVDAASLP